MELINVRTLRNQVAEVLRRAEQGERIVVGVNGRPVAQVGPLEPAGAPSLWDLAGAGLVEPPRRPDRPAVPSPQPVPVDVRVDRLLGEVRGR